MLLDQSAHTGKRESKGLMYSFFPVVTQPRRNPTTRHRSREVSQKVNMAVRGGGGHTTPSQTAPPSQKAIPSRRASLQSPNRSKLQKSKTSQLGRKSVWLT